MNHSERILVISHVLPYPGDSGQALRVRHTLRALKRRFHITLLTFAGRSVVDRANEQLADICDETIYLDSLYDRGIFIRTVHKLVGTVWSYLNSAKFSNYLIGRLEFSPARIAMAVRNKKFDIVLFEYWHSHKSAAVFQQDGIPCVLDMHNILWRAFEQQQSRVGMIPSSTANRRVQRYRSMEENAWNDFDGIIAINREEESYVRTNLPGHKRIFYAPMGIDLEKWAYSWRVGNTPSRVAYYGGLASPHNQESALQCYYEIMPGVWKGRPDAELWIVGSNPPDKLLELGISDPRVRVTGFVEDVQGVLANMSVIVCPWKGKYGFRSRLIEVMATGVPITTTPDAIYGMELTDGSDLLLGETSADLSNQVQSLLENQTFAVEMSRNARRKVEALYSNSSSYDRLAADLQKWLKAELAEEIPFGSKNNTALHSMPQSLETRQ